MHRHFLSSIILSQSSFQRFPVVERYDLRTHCSRQRECGGHPGTYEVQQIRRHHSQKPGKRVRLHMLYVYSYEILTTR